MKKYYIFDFDGTIVDSMPYWGETMLNILDKNNISYPDDIIKIITPLGLRQTAKFFQELGLRITIDGILRDISEEIIPKYRDTIGFKPFVREYLEMLGEKGVSLNILTASPHNYVDICLKRLGAAHYFENIWSCDDFGLSKSNPEIFQKAVAKLGGTLEDTVFFDDNVGACKGAVSAGIYTVGVYDKSGEEFIRELKDTADYYIKSFKELLSEEPF